MGNRVAKADAALTSALTASAKRAGVDLSIVAHDWTRWASQTFTGARHELTATASDTPALADWLGELPEAELQMLGHLVADVIVNRVSREGGYATMRLEALTVEE